MVKQPQTKTRLTAREFFELPETNTPEELLDGEVIMSPAPVPKHQLCVANVYDLLKGLVPDGRVFFAPVGVFLDEGNVPEPDLVWVSEGGKCRIGDRYLEGAPDLIVEVLSPGTALRDKTTKFRLYEQHGVNEYWLADPDAQYLEVWRLDGKKFIQQGVFGPGDTFESAVLGGKTVELRAVFPEDQPEAK
jgi:Uma2 family endonuclease